MKISSSLLTLACSVCLVLPAFGTALADNLQAKDVQKKAEAKKPVPDSRSAQKNTGQLKEKAEQKIKSDKSSEPAPIQKPKARGFEKKSAGRSASFVPPPPPVVPTLNNFALPSNLGGMVFVGENIDYLPKAELVELKERTDNDLARLRRNVDQLAFSSQEKLQRATNFESLYTEGVVSRRELETTKRESDSLQQDLADAKRELNLLEQKYIKIEKRLRQIEAKEKQKAAKHKSPRK